MIRAESICPNCQARLRVPWGGRDKLLICGRCLTRIERCEEKSPSEAITAEAPASPVTAITASPSYPKDDIRTIDNIRKSEWRDIPVWAILLPLGFLIICAIVMGLQRNWDVLWVGFYVPFQTALVMTVTIVACRRPSPARFGPAAELKRLAGIVLMFLAVLAGTTGLCFILFVIVCGTVGSK